MIQTVISTITTMVIQNVQAGSVKVDNEVDIANNGNVAAVAGAYIAKFFCGTNATDKVLHTFGIGAIGIGAEAVETGSVVVNIPANCTHDNVVFIQVQDTMANGLKTCLCAKPAGTISISGTPLATILIVLLLLYKAVMFNLTGLWATKLLQIGTK